MKLSNKLIFFLVSLFPITAQTQNSFKKGIIITASNERINDSLKLSRGKLIAISPGHKQKTFQPGDIKGFSIDSVNYVAFSNDFYKEVITGNKANLYQKISDNSDEKIYVGPDMVGFLKTTDGRIGDFYVQITGEKNMVLITKKEFRDYFSKLFASNDSLSFKIKNGDLRYSEINEVVKLYNNY